MNSWAKFYKWISALLLCTNICGDLHFDDDLTGMTFDFTRAKINMLTQNLYLNKLLVDLKKG